MESGFFTVCVFEVHALGEALNQLRDHFKLLIDFVHRIM